MSRDDAHSLDELLAALDMQLAAGGAPEWESEPDLPPDQLRLFRFARDSLLELERAWPRTSLRPDATAPSEVPSFDWLTGSGWLGKFRIHRELGRGGNGIVFLATDTLKHREVALKLPRLEALLDPELRDRFLQEARLTVGLDHPGLVPIYEAGEVGAICYIASAYANETTLTAWLQSQVEPVPPRTAAALVAALARGVEYLHDRRILHRDIKPSNVLLGPLPCGALPDAELATSGIPRLTDFGLAKCFDTTAAGTVANETTSATVAGTPEYMAPEQTDGRPELLGRPTDVYGLGAVLYELLAGLPPFRGRNKFDTLQQVTTREPRRLRLLRKDVPAALEAVCLKCLEKHPRDRYATASELSEDLQCFLAGQPTRAHRMLLWQRVRKWKQRRPLVAALVVTLLALPILIFGYLGFRKAALSEEGLRLQNAWDARAKGLELCGRGDIGVGLLWLAQGLKDAPDSADELQELLRLDMDAWQSRHPTLVGHLPHPDQVVSVQFSPDSRVALTLCEDCCARVWDADTGNLLSQLQHRDRVLWARFETDGQIVNTLCADGSRHSWSVENGELLGTESAPQSSEVDRKGLIAERLWEFATGRAPPRVIPEGPTWRMTCSADGRQLATISFANVAEIWKEGTAELRRLSVGSGANTWDAAFTPDGDMILTASDDGHVRFWDVSANTECRPAIVHPGPVHAVACDPRGRLLATGDADTVRLWDLKTGMGLLSLPRQSLVRTVAFSADGERLGSGHGKNGVRLWRLPPSPTPALIHPAAGNANLGKPTDPSHGIRLGIDGILDVEFHPDGRRIFSAGVDDTVRVWDPENGQSKVLCRRGEIAFSRLAVDPTGAAMLVGSRDRTAQLRDLNSGRALGPEQVHERWVAGAAFSPDGTVVATGSLGKDTLRVWNPRTGHTEVEFGPVAAVYNLQFSPDGRWILAGGDSCAYLCDRNQKRLHTLPHLSGVYTIAYHPAGDQFVTAGADGELHLWKSQTQQCQASIPAHTSRVRTAAFSPSGQVLVTGGWDKKLIFWHSATSRLIGAPTHLPAEVQCAAFDPSGRTIVAGCKNGEIHFVRAPRALEGTPQDLFLAMQTLTGLKLGPAGELQSLDSLAWRQQQK